MPYGPSGAECRRGVSTRDLEARNSHGSRRLYLRLLLGVSLAFLLYPAPKALLLGQEPALEESEEGLRLEVPESVTLAVLVDLVSQRLGLNVLYDETLESATLRVRAPKALTEEGLLALLESALRFRGYTLIEGLEEGWIEVVQMQEALGRGAPLVLSGKRPPKLSPYRMITQVIPLKHGVRQ